MDKHGRGQIKSIETCFEIKRLGKLERNIDDSKHYLYNWINIQYMDTNRNYRLVTRFH